MGLAQKGSIFFIVVRAVRTALTLDIVDELVYLRFWKSHRSCEQSSPRKPADLLLRRNWQVTEASLKPSGKMLLSW